MEMPSGWRSSAPPPMPRAGGTARSRLVHQALALEHAEAVLLIDGHQTQARELRVIFDERVRADSELRFAGANALERGGLFRGLEAADEQLDAISPGLQNPARGEEVLHGENFRGGHQGGLAAGFHGDHGRLPRGDGLTPGDVSLP